MFLNQICNLYHFLLIFFAHIIRIIYTSFKTLKHHLFTINCDLIYIFHGVLIYDFWELFTRIFYIFIFYTLVIVL